MTEQLISQKLGSRCRTIASVIVVMMLATTIACGDDQAAVSPSTLAGTSTTVGAMTTSSVPTSVETSSTSAAASSTVAPTAAPTVPPTPPTSAPGPATTSTCPAQGNVSEFERVTRCFYDAWQRGDRQLAADFAEPVAVDELFGAFRAEWEFQGCDQGYDDSWLGWGCSYVASNPATGYAAGIGFTFVAYDDVTVVKHVSFPGE